VLNKLVLVALVNTAVNAVSKEEKKPVEEVELVVVKLVIVPLVLKRLVEVLLVVTKLVDVAKIKDALDEKRLVDEAKVVKSVVPVAFPSIDEPEVNEVNVGLEDTDIVEVEERSILDPAVK